MVPPDGTRRLFSRLTLADRRLIEYAGGYHALFADLDAERVLDDVARWIEERL
jgi:alpha-beta hydrolase superfamily lysophospholipase